MGVTQYIGARYVPLFADPIEWDINTAYEPLTIVLYQGNSYTSRQSVPKGIDITNGDFWALTGNYNAQIEQYRRVSQVVADSLPSDEFDSENTVKAYIDNTRVGINARIDEDIDRLEEQLANVDVFSSIKSSPDYLEGSDVSQIINSSGSNIAFPAGSYLIASDVTSDATLYFAKGAVLTISNNVKVSIREVIAPKSQIFSGYTNEISISESDIYVEWFGARNDGTFDSTKAIQDAINACNGNSVVLQSGHDVNATSSGFAPSDKCYRITDTLVIDKQMDFGARTELRAVIFSEKDNAIEVGNMNSQTSSTNVIGCIVRNIEVVTSGVANLRNDSPDSYAVKIIGNTYGRFTNINVTGSRYAFYIKATVTCQFFRCTQNVGDFGIPLDVSGCGFFVENRNSFNWSNSYDKCFVSTMNGIVEHGMYFTGGTTGNSSDIYVNNFEAIQTRHGVHYSSATDATAINVHFNQLVLDDLFGTAIEILCNTTIYKAMVHINDSYILANPSNTEPLIKIDSVNENSFGGVVINGCFIRKSEANDAPCIASTENYYGDVCVSSCVFAHAKNAINVAVHCQSLICTENEFDNRVQDSDYFIRSDADNNIVANCMFKSFGVTTDNAISVFGNGVNVIGCTFGGSFTHKINAATVGASNALILSNDGSSNRVPGFTHS